MILQRKLFLYVGKLFKIFIFFLNKVKSLSYNVQLRAEP